MIKLNYRIRDLREDKDLTQTDIANLLNIHQTTYSSYELGDLNIPVSVLNKLADFYKTSIDYLVGRTDEKNHILEVNQKNNFQFLFSLLL